MSLAPCASPRTTARRHRCVTLAVSHLDTNVLVSALITPHGASARLLTELYAGAFELVTSPRLLDELRDVLARSKSRRYVMENEAEAYADLIRQESIVQDDLAPVGSNEQPADPDDRSLVDLARAARVHALVSGDAQVLDLRPAVPVMTPAEFLASLEDG